MKTGLRFRHLLTSAVVKAAKRSQLSAGIDELSAQHRAQVEAKVAEASEAVSLIAADLADMVPLDAPPPAAGPLLVRPVGGGRRGAVVDDELHGEDADDVEFLDGDVPAPWDEALA